MERLIWYTMPGAVLATALVVLSPSVFPNDPVSPFWVLTVPFVGFLLHQTFRVLFEWKGGFARDSRACLDEIRRLGKGCNPPVQLSRSEAFSVWELTFYGSQFPAAYREHNRGAWHYILSFWSIAFSAGVGCLVATVVAFAEATFEPLWQVALPVAVVGLLFYLKGRQTHETLVAEERDLVRVEHRQFRSTLLGLSRHRNIHE